MSTKRKPQPNRRRPAKSSVTPRPLGPPPGSLLPEAEADLHFLEPNRSRDRLVAILNEFGRRIAQIEMMHNDG